MAQQLQELGIASIFYAGIGENQKIINSMHYTFISLEEEEQFRQMYKNTRIGRSKEEQMNTSNRIYKLICMKRRMNAKTLKKQQK